MDLRGAFSAVVKHSVSSSITFETNWKNMTISNELAVTHDESSAYTKFSHGVPHCYTLEPMWIPHVASIKTPGLSLGLTLSMAVTSLSGFFLSQFSEIIAKQNNVEPLRIRKYVLYLLYMSQDEKTFVKWKCTKPVCDFPFISLCKDHLILLTPDQWPLWDLFTHSIDSRQLLWKVQHDGNEDSLAIHGGAEELWDGHLLLSHHLLALLPHLLHVRAHFIGAPQFY